MPPWPRLLTVACSPPASGRIGVSSLSVRPRRGAPGWCLTRLLRGWIHSSARALKKAWPFRTCLASLVSCSSLPWSFLSVCLSFSLSPFLSLALADIFILAAWFMLWQIVATSHWRPRRRRRPLTASPLSGPSGCSRIPSLAGISEKAPGPRRRPCVAVRAALRDLHRDGLDASNGKFFPLATATARRSSRGWKCCQQRQRG